MLWSTRATEDRLDGHLDWDGLTSHSDPVQICLAQINEDHDRCVRQLQLQIDIAKSIITEYRNTSVITVTDAQQPTRQNEKREMVYQFSVIR